MLTVVKAECLSNEDVSKEYSFPDEDDDLTNYMGKGAHLMIPSTLLQNIFSEFPCTLLESSYICSLLNYYVICSQLNTILFLNV